MKIKILAISHMWPVPYDELNGTAIHKQIKELLNQGYDVKVISPIAWTPFPIKYVNNKWKAYSEVPEHTVYDGIEVFYPRFLSFPKALFMSSSGYRMYYGIRRLVKELYKDFPFELVHAHMALPDGYAGMLISMKYRKPLVVTFQATDLDITANRSRRCLLALQKVFSYAKTVIAPSPRLAKALVSRFGIEPVVIGYGIDASEVITTRSELLSSYQGRRIVLSVSRLIPTKGIDLNIFALKHLVSKYGNLLYIVVGDGPERPVLERLTRELNLTKHVIFIGQVPHKRAMEYMAACEVFTLPSWQETFGLVYIEAMAHGKPVIGVQGQGVDGIVVHGQNGLLAKPRDVDSLVEALDYLLSHPDEAKAMGERARKFVLENYTWEKNAEKTIKVYEEVLSGS